MKIPAKKSDSLIIFFDGACPLCCVEMQKLSQADKRHQIILIDLHNAKAMLNFPEISKVSALKILHGYYQGKLLLALDVTYRAWTIVGKGLWVAPLQLPLIKPISHIVYLILAKYRHAISHALSKHFGLGKNLCKKGTCYDKNNITHWSE